MNKIFLVRLLSTSFLLAFFFSMCLPISLAEDSAVVAEPSNQLSVSEALAAYVKKKDDSYQWKKVAGGKVGKAEYVELILTSQNWRDTVWKHQLYIMKPSVIDDSKQAVLMIAGGRWKDEYETAAGGARDISRQSVYYAGLAERMKTPVAVLLQVPQQPMFDGRVEDQLISLTFDRFLKTRDPEWPLLLPMVKSTVRGMDAIQEFCNQEWSLDVQSFTVTGASKRGWTTWLTGAVEPRATALAPMVIDMLNMGQQMKHQNKAWGGYSEQIHDYTERGLQQQLQTPGGRDLQQIVDPYAYRTELKQPKLIILGTNDRYWPLDALNLYWDGLQGKKHILYIPNNGHGLRDVARLSGGLTALHEQARGGKPMPKLAWDFAKQTAGLMLKTRSDETISDFRIWSATSKTRDFRDARWSSVAVLSEVSGNYQHQASTPESGFRAFFGEATYKRDSYTFYLSTNVRIIASEKEGG